LVHEAYLRLIDVTNVDWQHRAHFFAVSAQIMRRILLDQARRRAAAKRGGEATQVDLDEIPAIGGGRAEDLIALDDALKALAQIDPRKAQVIEVLKVSQETVLRDWRLARAWLLAQLSGKK